MGSYIITEQELLSSLKKIALKNKLFLPKNTGEYYLFKEWDRESLPGTDYLNTLKPPKDLFFPQDEMLIKYQKDQEGRPKITDSDMQVESRVIFGIRPC